MRSDEWLAGKIVKESVNKHDISYMRVLIQQGKSDEEILLCLRKRILSNSIGMREYIRHEKIRALMVKLSSGIHWVCLLPVIKNWITEKEALVRWRESEHSGKIEETVKQLKNRLIDDEYKKMKFDCANGEGLPEKVMGMLERAAEDLLVKIEEEECERFQTSRDKDPATQHAAPVPRAVPGDGKGSSSGETRRANNPGHLRSPDSPLSMDRAVL